MRATTIYLSLLLFNSSVFGQVKKWTSLGNGLDSTVHALKADRNTHVLYVGGQFKFSNDDTLNHIAKWENGKWHSLNNGLNDWVGAIEFYKNEIYVGGAFTNANGIKGKGNKIAKWNGQEWFSVGDSIGSGANGNITSLCVFNNTLIVGGYFTRIGNITANHIAMWDGKEWKALGEGVNDVVYSIKVYKNKLYVGGAFSQAGNLSVNNIAMWNGNIWSPLENGITDEFSAYVFCMEVHKGKLYVGGSFNYAGKVKSENLAVWNSKQWKPTQINSNSTIYFIRKYKNNLLLAISSYSYGGVEPNFIGVMKRNKIKKTIGSLGNDILCMELIDDDLFVGGHFTTANRNKNCNRIAQYKF